MTLTQKEAKIVRMMRVGFQLWRQRYSRLYGLYTPQYTLVETVQDRVVESLLKKGLLTIGSVGGTSTYVLRDTEEVVSE